MDDNTFECPHCGTTIYPEMTRCPQCGQNIYPEDEEATTEDDSTGLGLSSIAGIILLGWVVAFGIAFIIHFIVAGFITPAALGPYSRAVLLLAGPIGSFVGGYVGAMLARQKHKTLGGTVGVLAVPISALLATHWVKVTVPWLTNPWIVGVGFVIVMAGIGGGWLNQVLSRDGEWKENLRVRGWEDFLYQDLLRKVRFNGTAADRLIDYERKQTPQANRLKLIQSAIERWERDNR